MEEDNIVIKQAIASIDKRDKPIGEEGGCKPKEHIRGSQGLAEG